jgi:hypothetical protein
VTPSSGHEAATLLPARTGLRQCAKGDEKPADWPLAPLTKSLERQEKRKKILKNLTNDARMSMKTKGRCGKLAAEAGMSMKTKGVSRRKRESR